LSLSLSPPRDDDGARLQRGNAMTELKENLLDWLRDAHAMEQQAEQMLRAQASRIKHYPAVKQRIEQHLEETLGQQTLLKGCIQRLGGSTSVMKDVIGKVMAFGQAAGGMTNADEIVKGAISSYVFENLEIATYTALIAAAKTVGDAETQRACEQILPQEQAMAQWVLQHLPELTEEFLARDATPGVEAKR
jgi:ferritin-like metal-binding protein YciE